MSVLSTRPTNAIVYVEPLVHPDLKSVKNITNILFIDKRVKEFEYIVNSVNQYTFPIVYSSNSSKNDVDSLLAKLSISSINRVGLLFVSSEDKPKLFLDDEILFSNANDVNGNMEWIKNVIQKYQVKNIDFLACDTLQYSNWKNYYTYLATNTGVIVGASDNKTGNIKYGGDWVMESTNQNVESVYFSKNIESYKFLLDAPFFSTFSYSNSDANICADENYLYVSRWNGNIVKINATTGSNSILASGMSTLVGITIYNGFLYCASLFSNLIYQINPNNGSVVTWASLGFSPYGLYIENNTMYVADWSDGRIMTINMNTKAINTLVTGLGEGIFNLTIYKSHNSSHAINNYMYVVQAWQSKIWIIDVNTANIVTFFPTYNAPTGISIYDNKIYVSYGYGDGKIGVYGLTGTLLNANFYIPSNGRCYGLTNYNNLLYSSVIFVDAVAKIVLEPISNICFPAGTPITTNQGNICIEKINPNIHTIRNKPIVGITKVVSTDKYLVCFEKDSLGPNIPCEKTFISKQHIVFHKGQAKPAMAFLNNDTIYKVKYTGETLYNVLMDTHDKMMVNNMICETLDPKNGVALLYKDLQKMSYDKQCELIKEYNDYAMKNNVFNKTLKTKNKNKILK